jgi:type II secretion system protein G
LYFRIDTEEDLSFIRAADVVLGLVFAVAFLLAAAAARDDSRPSKPLGILVRCLIVWGLLSGALLLWHEFQIRVRWTVPKRSLAANQILRAQAALAAYAKDCGGYPSEKQGLKALVENPGLPAWAGPYLDPESLTDPWGNPLQYRVRNNRPEVWSAGPDGQSGTDDDVRWDAEEGGQVPAR